MSSSTLRYPRDGNIDGKVLNELLMYMPQDVSTSMSTSWGGKEITNAAAGMLAGYANLSTGDVGGVLQNVGAGLSGLNALPTTAATAVVSNWRSNKSHSK